MLALFAMIVIVAAIATLGTLAVQSANIAAFVDWRRTEFNSRRQPGLDRFWSELNRLDLPPV